MRQDYAAFTARDAAVLAIGPDGPRAYQRFWEENEMPLIGLADPKHTVADLYRQEVNLLPSNYQVTGPWGVAPG